MTSLVDRLRTITRCPTSPPETILGIETCCPAEDSFKDIRRFVRDEHKQYANNTRALVEVPSPPFLQHIDPSDTELLDGSWIVERKIEYHTEISPSRNVSQWWRLPKRLELAQWFIDSTEITARVVQEGLLAHTATSQQQKMVLSLPDPEDLFTTVLYRRPFLRFNDVRHESVSRQICQRGDVSDKGQYLTGATGRFGGLWEAYAFVESRFWRRVFSQLSGGSRRVEEGQRLIATLKKRLKGDRVEVAFEHQWRSLASVVNLEAHRIRFPRRYARFDSLYAQWMEDLAAFLSESPSLHERIEEMVSRAAQELEESLTHLCSKGVFTQGVEFRCDACGTRSRFSVESLMPKLQCSLCGRSTQLPVRFDWHFFFDSSLAESIREHGTLPQIWALGALFEQARDCFIYLPPQELLLTDSNNPVEVDLICLIDGKLVIGEVKPSASDFHQTDQESLCILAEALDPDTVILSCMERKSSALETIVSRMRERLKGLRCEVVALTPAGRFFEGDCYLPS